MSSNQASSSRSSSTSGVVTPSNSGSLSSSSPSDGKRRSTWSRIAEDGSMRPVSGVRRTPPYLHQCITTTEDPDNSDEEEEDDEGIADLEPAVGATEGGEDEDLEAMEGEGSPSSHHSSLVLRSEESSAASGEEHVAEMAANTENFPGSAGEDFGEGREVAEVRRRIMPVINVSSDSSDDSDYLVVSASTASKRRVTSVKRPTGPVITYGQLKRRRPNYASDEDDSSDDIMELKPLVQKKRPSPNSFANFVVPRSRLLDESNSGGGASGDVVVTIDSKPTVGSKTSASLLSTNHPQSVKSLPTSAVQFGGSSRMDSYGSRPMSVEQRTSLAQGLPLDAVLPTLSSNEPSSSTAIMPVAVSPRLRNPPSPPQLTDDASLREDGEVDEDEAGAELGWVSNAIVKEFNRRAPELSRARASHASHPEQSLVPMQTSSDGFNWSRKWGVTPWPQSTIYAEIERRQSKWPVAYQEINRGIWQHLGANLQNADTYLWKMGVRQQIEALIKQELPNSHLIAVGSTINGCGSYNSDMDLCLCVYDHRGQLHEKRGFAQRNLRRLHRQLYQLPIVEEVEYINAKVPILRLDLRPPYNTLQIDINVNNTPGIYNSYLLHYYSRLDDRFPALCLVIKHWAKSVGIGDASEGSFNSYSLNLMVLHFLQVGTSPPILPNLLKLYPKYFAVNQPLGGMKLFRDLPKPPPPAPKNDRSVAQLLVALFEYYSNFNYDFHAISIVEGRVIPRARFRHTLSRHTDRYPIFIEEPYERENTARCVSNSGMWGRIQAAFNEARDALHRGKKPPSLEALNIRPEDYGGARG